MRDPEKRRISQSRYKRSEKGRRRNREDMRRLREGVYGLTEYIRRRERDLLAERERVAQRLAETEQEIECLTNFLERGGS